ncbi:MAG TPA: selenocysteine-specific translation elongation factor [Vicinamibacterales bacterium]|nr:selenocysteine-specific translation elongation factor [Vicinamibacterales bacterium]
MKSIVVGTAGHIDHGKSALVRALTGTDPDRLKEEKARGITIDLGFAHAEIDGTTVAFVDVPGHERFVKNMLAGVGGIDAIVLVVAADESVMPQTREHFDICRLLRVRAGFVALTKADLVDADMLALVREEVQELVAGSFLAGAPIVPVSSKTGAGLDEVRAVLAGIGRTLPGRPADGPVRLPIDRVFSVKGFGTVVTGTLGSGTIRVDDELALLPGDRAVKVRGLQVHGRRQDEARAGHRTAVNLSGVEVADVARGQALVTPGQFRESRVVDAVLELLPTARGLKHGARIRFHHGTAERLGRVIVAGPPRGGSDAGGRAAPEIPPGARAYVRLRLESPAVLVRGDRYILRAYSPSTTIAGGGVLDPRPVRTRVRTAAALEHFRQLDFAPDGDAASRARDDERAIRAVMSGAGAAGLPVADLTTRFGYSGPARDALVAGLTSAQAAFVAGDVLVAPAVVEQLEARLLGLLRDHHAAQPLSEGIPREDLRRSVAPRAEPAVFDLVVGRLAGAGRIGGRDRVALASHRVALSPEEARACSAIERAYGEAGLTPPEAATIAGRAGVAPAVIEQMVRLLLRQKRLVRVDPLIFHADALARLKDEVRRLGADAGGGEPRIDVATFKERFGVSRKFAIPLLEYLDRERVTRRIGDARVVL